MKNHLAVVSAVIAGLFIQSSANADVTYIGKGLVPGNAMDHSGQAGNILTNSGADTGIPNATFGAAGSAIDYTGADNLYIMASDRGPNNGDAQILDRVHYVRINIQPGTSEPVSVSLVKTTMLKSSAGFAFTGSSAAFVGNTGYTQPETLRLDPEGVRLSKDPAALGSFWISDEYGPYVLKFDRDGRKIGAIELPVRYLASSPSADAEKEIASNTMGRQPNRGMEGLALTPDGKTLVCMMQNALMQDHALDASHARVSNFTRILTVNLADSTMREFVYAFDSNKVGSNEILAINDHEFLVIERDGKPGNEATSKKIYKIDLAAATDISKPFTAGETTYDYTGTTADNGLPAQGPISGVKTVMKSLFIDMLAPALALAGSDFPEKIEGLAWGPDFENGDRLLIVTSDNDFVLSNPTYFYAFRVSRNAIETTNAK